MKLMDMMLLKNTVKSIVKKAHAHQSPTFDWHIHIKHLEVEGHDAHAAHGHGHDSAPSESFSGNVYEWRYFNVRFPF